MKPCFFIGCLLLILTFSGCRQDAAKPQIEKDTKVKREVFDIAKHPALTAVGKINFIGQRWCSAILVSDDIAVTAGHCFLESNFKFDLTKDLDEFYTSVIFKPDGEKFIKDISVRRVLKAGMNPDYAIVKLNKKISANVIKPLKISNLNFDEMLSNQERLGCAGFNGGKELGSEGMLMTISRNIKIIPETSSPNRIDVNCFSTYGGSGGLFFEEKYNAETGGNEYAFIGVIWGLTDGKFNEKGEFIKDDTMITSITPVSVFYDELTKIIDEN